jgi:hypothetical protein
LLWLSLPILLRLNPSFLERRERTLRGIRHFLQELAVGENKLSSSKLLRNLPDNPNCSHSNSVYRFGSPELANADAVEAQL